MFICKNQYVIKLDRKVYQYYILVKFYYTSTIYLVTVQLEQIKVRCLRKYNEFSEFFCSANLSGVRKNIVLQNLYPMNTKSSSMFFIKFLTYCNWPACCFTNPYNLAALCHNYSRKLNLLCSCQQIFLHRMFCIIENQNDSTIWIAGLALCPPLSKLIHKSYESTSKPGQIPTFHLQNVVLTLEHLIYPLPLTIQLLKIVSK